MLRHIERWPRRVRDHHNRHFKAGVMALSTMPTKTRGERYVRAMRGLRFHFRLSRHLVRSHPDVFNDPWLRRVIAPPGSAGG